MTYREETQVTTVDEWMSLLPYSHECKQAEFNMGISITRAYDAARIELDDVKHLIVESQIHRHRKPSDATTYRWLAKWREIIESLANPGNGA